MGVPGFVVDVGSSGRAGPGRGARADGRDAVVPALTRVYCGDAVGDRVCAAAAIPQELPCLPLWIFGRGAVEGCVFGLMVAVLPGCARCTVSIV